MTSVAHLKALIILYWNLDRPEAWHNFYYGPALSKKAILHLKMATVRFDLNTAVHVHGDKICAIFCSLLKILQKLQTNSISLEFYLIADSNMCSIINVRTMFQ